MIQVLQPPGWARPRGYSNGIATRGGRLVFIAGQNAGTLGLKGDETFHIPVTDKVKPKQVITVSATRPDGTKLSFDTICRIDTPVEVDYYRNGGILQTVLRKMAKA